MTKRIETIVLSNETINLLGKGIKLTFAFDVSLEIILLPIGHEDVLRHATVKNGKVTHDKPNTTKW